MKGNDLRTKLTCFSIAIVMIPMIILYLLILAFFNNRSLRENRRYAYYNIQNISGSLDSALTGLNEISLYMLINNFVYDYMTRESTNSAYIRMNASLQFLPFSSKYYHSIFLFSGRNRTLNSGRYYDISLSEKEREKADALGGGSFFSVRPEGVYLVRLIRNFNRLSEKLGYIKILVNQSALLELFTPPDLLPGTGCLLLFDEGVLLQSGSLPPTVVQNSVFSFAELRDAGRRDSVTVKAGGGEFIYSSRPVFAGKAVIVSILDRGRLYRLDSLLLESVAAGLLMSVFFVAILSWYYTKRVFDPLNELGEVMRNIDRKDFEPAFYVKGNNEITVLVEQFNLMCKRLKSLYGQIYRDRLKLKEAELAVLQSRIDPHFLCNTLDTIYWMSEMSQTWKISSMVQSLSTLFRGSVENTEGSLVPIQTEQQYVRCYLAIQKVRFQDQISFEFYIQDNLDDFLVLKLLLQPVVENAIVHGAEPAGGGRVVINIYRDAGDIIYTVFNTGDPVDTDDMEALMSEDNNNRRGLAVRNVNSRLQMYFGENYRLRFENRPGGVLVTIRQPERTGGGGDNDSSYDRR